nr:RDD family protein [Rhabdothermincola salaria]
MPTPPDTGPEAPDPTDVSWKRAIAAVIDVGIAAVISIPLFAVLSEEVYRFDTVTRELVVSQQLDGLGAVAFYSWLLAYAVGVFVLQRGFTGRTVGTLLLGVAVVGADGRPLGPANALVRSVAGVVDYFPCCLPLVGLITMFVTRDHRRVGDMAARSYAIDAGRMGHPVLVPGTRTATAPPTAPAPPDPPGRPVAPPPPAGWPAPTPTGWSPPGSTPARSPAPGPPTPPRPAAPATAGCPAPSGPPTRQVPPTPPPAAAPVVPEAPISPPAAPSPTAVWNPERRAYMAWDARRREWLQFDQATQRWLQYDLVQRRWRPVGPR